MCHRSLTRLPLAASFAVWLAVAAVATPATAHKLFVFATVRGKLIEGEAYYQGGDPAPDVKVAILAPDGLKLDEMATDSDGRFQFEPRFSIDHKLSADAGFGHRAEYTVEVAELPTSLPPYSPDAAGVVLQANLTDESTPEPVRSPPHHDHDPAAEIEALTQQIVALRRDLDRWKAQLRMQDILGGIGYILGIMGLASYLLRKKQASSTARG
jgi:nickel transport protein